MTNPTGFPLYSMVVDDVKLATTLPEGNPEILFVGDSHAAQYVPRIKKLSEESGIQTGVITCLGCFAVPESVNAEIINTIKGKSILYVYSNAIKPQNQKYATL